MIKSVVKRFFGETREFSPEFYGFSFLSIALVYLAGASLIRLMDVDASQYASISLEMMQSGNFLEIYHRGNDYLDKPPFLFWSSLFFFKLFGVGEFSYRFSSLFFLGLGAYSTYALGKEVYSREAGLLAAIFMLSNQAFFLSGHDVRTDTILAGSVIFSIWQAYLFLRSNSWKNLFLFSLGMAISMMEKGPIGLMVPVLAFFPAWALERDWKKIFRWEWIVVIILVLIFLIPMSIGLYQQFDLHPEKIVNGRQGVSGLRFFFWEQSFGRLTGENVWKDDSTPLFFTHTFLWAFLPWMILAIGAFVDWIISWFRSLKGVAKPSHNFIFTGFILPFMAFSLSQFKLPHYINVVFPLAALFTAGYVYKLLQNGKPLKGYVIAQGVVNFLLLAVCMAVTLWFFPLYNPLIWIVFLVYVGFSVFLFLPGKSPSSRVIGSSLMMILAANIILNLHFYPRLLKFQPGSTAAKYVLENDIDPGKIKRVRVNGHEDYHMHSLDFYLRYLVPYVEPEDLQTELFKGDIVFGDPIVLEELASRQIPYSIIQEFDQFHVTQLNFIFLIPNTRAGQLGRRYLVEIGPES